MREGSSIAATKASAVSWPTPGMVISRLQAAEALAIRLMSASIAATAVITAVRAAIRPRMAADRPVIPSLALRALSTKAAVSARGESDPQHDRQASDLIFQGHSLADQLLARDDQRAESVGRQRLHVDGLEEPSAGQMRQPPRVVAIGLVGRQRLERLVGLPAFDADYGQTELVQPVKQDWRHSSGLEHDATTTRRFRQFAGDRLCCRRRLALANHHAFTVENANMRLVHRDIETSEIVR
jgi:hypothetical protein